jgi:hypothetical protein
VAAYADRHHLSYIGFRMGNGKGAHLSEYSIGNDERFMGFSVGEQDGELIPLVPSCQICRAAECRLEALSNLPEAGITSRTTVVLIEWFKIINIAEQERERVSCFLRIEPSSFELPVKMTPIGDAC